ncbi:Ribosome-binding ATPase YchF [Candidatus Hydrogenisulfobacillus filiaventi]|uniref:Ribosome-binding ATPase YchF n=1 Tax=Candidatus Hydrogenisulfobacillus filiaventi TaxID=2707344 RepID=A0A6F8ZJ33_9FIRM|nr:redox-regulated ATPase YchF [Bacillota bacterium]CAB1129786.1 Ribosome-binding ATPase YchF [Candidatus Hydrogenisulfobacillus filiaventi]
MDVGLIGLPLSGKTTVFNLLTGSGTEVNRYGGSKAESHHAMAAIPDRRLDRLAALYHPRKVTPAQLAVVDVPGLMRQEQGGPNRFLNDVRQVDALLHVVRGFSDAAGTPARPYADIEEMELELGLADLDLLEKRRERLRSGRKGPKAQDAAELALIDRLTAALEDNRRLEQLELSEEERRMVAGYRFLTLKPMLWLINLSEDDFRRGDYPQREQVEALAAAKGVPVLTLAGAMEAEIQALSPADRAEFLADLGTAETGLERVARAVYARLGLISFLTAGEDEVRAWPIAAGTVAKAAAGKIHSDIERGFIRAEVVAFEDLDRAGSMARAREAGLVRLEGRDYVMRDGDVVNFRFNV